MLPPLRNFGSPARTVLALNADSSLSAESPRNAFLCGLDLADFICAKVLLAGRLRNVLLMTQFC